MGGCVYCTFFQDYMYNTNSHIVFIHIVARSILFLSNSHLWGSMSVSLDLRLLVRIWNRASVCASVLRGMFKANNSERQSEGSSQVHYCQRASECTNCTKQSPHSALSTTWQAASAEQGCANTRRLKKMTSRFSAKPVKSPSVERLSDQTLEHLRTHGDRHELGFHVHPQGV